MSPSARLVGLETCSFAMPCIDTDQNHARQKSFPSSQSLPALPRTQPARRAGGRRQPPPSQPPSQSSSQFSS
eukprot:6178386-Pleurochrysis_carterae.AAC.2